MSDLKSTVTERGIEFESNPLFAEAMARALEYMSNDAEGYPQREISIDIGKQILTIKDDTDDEEFPCLLISLTEKEKVTVADYESEDLMIDVVADVLRRLHEQSGYMKPHKATREEAEDLIREAKEKANEC